MPDTTDNRPSSKVARLIAEYGLDGLGDELEARWTGDGVERTSLRDLADYFNERLLEQTLIDAGMNALESDVSTMYRNLTDEDYAIRGYFFGNDPTIGYAPRLYTQLGWPRRVGLSVSRSFD
jgi:hypothetical protein